MRSSNHCFSHISILFIFTTVFLSGFLRRTKPELNWGEDISLPTGIKIADLHLHGTAEQKILCFTSSPGVIMGCHGQTRGEESQGRETDSLMSCCDATDNKLPAGVSQARRKTEQWVVSTGWLVIIVVTSPRLDHSNTPRSHRSRCWCRRSEDPIKFQREESTRPSCRDEERERGRRRKE